MADAPQQQQQQPPSGRTTVVAGTTLSPAGTTVADAAAAPKPDAKAEARAGREAQRKGARLARPDDEQREGRKMPPVGEVVHYVLPFAGGGRGQHRPMVVTSVATPNRAGINGHVLVEPGDGVGDTHYFAQDVPYHPDKLVGTWHYAETDEQEVAEPQA